MTGFRWAPYLNWLRVKYQTTPQAEMAQAFYDEHGHIVTSRQIRAALRNHKIRSGRTGRFEKGQKGWNIGIRGYMGANVTSFKKGNLPHNHKPLWSERIDKNGYIEISVPEKNPYTGFATRYKHKHVWIWEQANGKKPKGSVIVFEDGDNRNFEPENLILVTRAELLVMNLHGYKDQPSELKPSVLALARLEAKAKIRTRPSLGRKKHKASKGIPKS